jgi:hypothetical protein
VARGETFASFADAAHFSSVRDTWRAVVAPNYLFFIGLLMVFEATMGVLVLTGAAGRRLACLGSSGCKLACCCLVG